MDFCTKQWLKVLKKRCEITEQLIPIVKLRPFYQSRSLLWIFILRFYLELLRRKIVYIIFLMHKLSEK